MIDIKATKDESINSQFFLKDPQKKELPRLEIGKVTKVRRNIEECEMVKFLGLSSVESVFAHDKAEHYLQKAREMSKTKDHGEVTDPELLKDLKKKFKENYEATGMSPKEYHD